MRQLGEALRLLRVFHDLSQTELADRLAISKSFVSEVEGGKKEPTLQLLDRYSQEFDISVSSLLFFAEKIEKADSAAGRNGVAPKVIKLLNWIAETRSISARKKPPQRQEGVPSRSVRRRFGT